MACSCATKQPTQSIPLATLQDLEDALGDTSDATLFVTNGTWGLLRPDDSSLRAATVVTQTALGIVWLRLANFTLQIAGTAVQSMAWDLEAGVLFRGGPRPLQISHAPKFYSSHLEVMLSPPSATATPLPSSAVAPAGNFDWKCLLVCAPQCASCTANPQDIVCWMLCAAECVVACLLRS